MFVNLEQHLDNLLVTQNVDDFMNEQDRTI